MAIRPFLSYAHEDVDEATRLRNVLRAAGINVWMDRYDLVGGENWKLAVKRALRESTHFIALISQKSVSKRGFVQRELRHALDLLTELPPQAVFVIPVRLDISVPTHDELRDLHWIDLFENYDYGIERLIASLQHGGRYPAPLNEPDVAPSATPPSARAAIDLDEIVEARAAAALWTWLSRRPFFSRVVAGDRLGELLPKNQQSRLRNISAVIILVISLVILSILFPKHVDSQPEIQEVTNETSKIPESNHGTRRPTEVNPASPSNTSLLSSYFTQPIPILEPMPTTAAKGTCQFRLLIDPEGHVREITELTQCRPNNEAIVHAMRTWLFTPAMESGHPVRASFVVQITFKEANE